MRYALTNIYQPMLRSEKMQALIKSNVIITLAALSLSGSSAWAVDENSFVARAKLDSYKLIPSILSLREAELTLTFNKPTPPTNGETLARAQMRRKNPWKIKAKAPGDESFTVNNIRVYFGQRFANGLPIATLCDNDIDTLKCEEGTTETGEQTFEDDELELHDIQFQGQQTAGGAIQVDPNGLRLYNDERGFEVIKDLIQRGLIYVVINSIYKAELGPDSDNNPETDDTIYTPDPNINVTPPHLQGGIIIDGFLRGTLSVSP
jgi:hypothetical protein